MARIPVDDEVRNVTEPLHREDAGAEGGSDADPILALRGTGKATWANEDADAYVERLRQGW